MKKLLEKLLEQSEWANVTELKGLERDYVEDIVFVLRKLFGNEFQYSGRNTEKLKVVSEKPIDLEALKKINSAGRQPQIEVLSTKVV